jgi:hypothetical protein
MDIPGNLAYKEVAPLIPMDGSIVSWPGGR